MNFKTKAPKYYFHNLRLPKELKDRMRANKQVDWAEFLRQQIKALCDQLDQNQPK